MKRWIMGLLILALLWQVPVASASETGLEGKTLSILGDSISTYAGYSDDASSNSTIGGSRLFYPRWGMGVQPEDTWWYQTAEILDMRLLVNNSWSGSCLLRAAHGAEGAYVSRCVQLHDDTGDNAGEEPDIIAIYLGTNDYYAYPDTLGTFDSIDFSTLIRPDGYAAPSTTLEAYAITLDKIQKRYPNAEVYCFTLLPMVGSDSQPAAFNADIRALAARFGCFWVDLSDCGISTAPEAFAVYMGDSLHPEVFGMDAITAAFVSSILEHSRYAPDARAVTYALTDAVSSCGTTAMIPAGKPFCTELCKLSDREYLDITVSMAGVDITPYCLEGNRISIARVVGDLTITATPVDIKPTKNKPIPPVALGGMIFGALQILP